MMKDDIISALFSTAIDGELEDLCGLSAEGKKASDELWKKMEEMGVDGKLEDALGKARYSSNASWFASGFRVGVRIMASVYEGNMG